MKKLLLLAATAMLSLGASAQGWVKPEAKTLAPADLANNGTLVRIYNVEYGAFVGGANAWGTQVSLLPEGLDYKLEWAENGQDFKLLTSSGGKSGKYLFRDSENDGFIDLGSQNRGFNFTITLAESGYYTIKSPNDDPVYGTEFYENAEHQFMGWNGDKNIVHFTVSDLPEENIDLEGNPVAYGIEWAFMSKEDAAALVDALAPYNAAMELKAVIDDAKANYATIDCSEAEAVYNNTSSTVEELQAAKALVANAIAAVRSQEVLEGASEENPIDGTELIENADFSTGDISGWTCTFVSGTTATNVGYQGAHYDGLAWEDEETGDMGTAFLDKFIEAWANNVDEMKRDGKGYATIGDAKLCQTIYGLPAGKYKLACDINAVQQYDGNQNPVTGVELYVLGGDIDSHISMATDNGVPQHYILNFIHSGGTVELGLRTKSTTANWIAADNFTLWYYGEINENPYKVILDGVVAGLEKKYEDMDDVIAEKSLKDAFTAALEAAQNCGSEGDDAYYQDLQASLEAAADALAKSIKAYETAYLQLEDISNKADEAGERGWDDLKDQLADYRDGLESKYEECELTPEEVEAIAPTIAEMVAAFVAANCKAGDDVSLLLNNTGFEKNFSGWEVTGTSPVWAANHAQGDNMSDYAQECDESAIPAREDGLAERYQAVFTMSQTIKNMPRGLYQLSCQGFNRKDGDGKPAELYAVLPNGSEQTAPFCDIAAYQTEASLYQVENGNDAWPADNVNGNGMYQPNGMSGAAWHFMHKSDGENYDYTNKFNIVMTEAGDLTVGVRCDNAKQWVIFDSFRIVYLGSGAAVYAEPIADKIAQGEKAIEAGSQYNEDYEIAGASAEVISAWKAVVDEANTAVESNDEEACIAAMGSLDKGIAAIEASNATAKKLMDKYIYATEYRLVDFAYNVDSDVLDAIFNQITEGFATDAAMEEAMVTLDAIFCQAVVNETEGIAEANEENPVDLSDVIANRLYASQTTDLWETTVGFGWNGEGYDDNSGENFTLAEVWNNTFATSQTLYALPAGYYRLKVNAFQRGYGFNVHSAACLDSLGNDVPEHLPAKLYANADSTCILSLFDNIDVVAGTNAYEGTGVGVNGGKFDGYIVPNSMTEAAAAFNAGLYQNILQFQVTEAGAPVKIGIVKTTNENDAWVIWGNWRLEYVGTAKPAVDPTTVITDVEIAENGAMVIFDLTGRRVNKAQKGLYIVNGQKVLVK